MEAGKYEYMLHTWGGFYNDEHKEKHGFKEGYFWFNSNEARQKYIDILKVVESEHNARFLITDLKDGFNLHSRTIAKMILVYNGKEYPFEYDFGYAYEAKNARFMFHDGNYSCDCNRKLFLHREYEAELGKCDFDEDACGNEIEMKNFEVIFKSDC